MKKIVIFLIFIVLFSSCSPAGTSTDVPVTLTATNAPLPTELPAPAATATPAPTATPEPSPTPAYPFLYGTPIPTPASSMLSINLDNLKEIVRWGQGDMLASTWSPDGSMLFISTRAGFNFYKAPELTRTAFIKHDAVTFPAISPDGKWLAVFTWKAVEVWDIQSQSLAYELTTPSTCLGLAFDAESGSLVGVFREDELSPINRMVWDAATGEVLQNASFPKVNSWKIQVSANLRYAVNRVTDSVNTVWDLVNEVEVFQTNFGFRYIEKYPHAISNDGRYIILGNALVFDLSGTTAVNMLTVKNADVVVEIKDGLFLFHDQLREKLTMVDLPTRKTWTGDQKLTLPLAIDRENNRFMDGSGRVFQIDADLAVQSVDLVDDYAITCCQISAQATYLAGWDASTLNLFSGSDGKLLASTLLEGGGRDDILLFTPDESRLIRVSVAGSTVDIFSVPDLAKLFTIPLAPIKLGNSEWVSASISPDGTYLAISEFPPRYLLILDLAAGKVAHLLQGRYVDNIFHPSGVLAVHFYDGGTAEYILKIDPASGREVGRISGNQLVGVAQDGVNLIVITKYGIAEQDWETSIVTPAQVSPEVAYVLDRIAAVTGAPIGDPNVMMKFIVQKKNRFYANFGHVFQIYELAP